MDEGNDQPHPPEHPAPEVNPTALKPFSDARAVVSEIYSLKATLDALALDLVADLDTRPEAIPQSRPDHVARTFLRSTLQRTPQEAKFDVDCAHRLNLDADPLDGGLPMMGRATGEPPTSRTSASSATACSPDWPATASCRPPFSVRPAKY